MAFGCANGRGGATLHTAILRAIGALLFALVVLLLVASPVCAASLEAVVVGVTDGDTLTVLDANEVRHKVRLAGIDAPERRQAFGTRARQALAAAVFRKAVTVNWNKRDRYGRLIGKVLAGERDVGLSLIQAGLAWHYKAYEREQSATDRQVYGDAELEARERRVGLWADVAPVPPWAFRR